MRAVTEPIVRDITHMQHPPQPRVGLNGAALPQVVCSVQGSSALGTTCAPLIDGAATGAAAEAGHTTYHPKSVGHCLRDSTPRPAKLFTLRGRLYLLDGAFLDSITCEVLAQPKLQPSLSPSVFDTPQKLTSSVDEWSSIKACKPREVAPKNIEALIIISWHNQPTQHGTTLDLVYVRSTKVKRVLWAPREELSQYRGSQQEVFAALLSLGKAQPDGCTHMEHCVPQERAGPGTIASLQVHVHKQDVTQLQVDGTSRTNQHSADLVVSLPPLPPLARVTTTLARCGTNSDGAMPRAEQHLGQRQGMHAWRAGFCALDVGLRIGAKEFAYDDDGGRRRLEQRVTSPERGMWQSKDVSDRWSSVSSTDLTTVELPRATCRMACIASVAKRPLLPGSCVPRRVALRRAEQRFDKDARNRGQGDMD
ncbi:hypothetical protein PCL_02357 [Purpureocillium lilacinum]|uniref:Uncharacterized protein n=1 Tax=Purpureocillium lilacinum TaxID=33203 RepID=A0A2U3E0F5_PURLI|nr:hypothetical protein PCL_02357 [Purpureocillium lilacinum]